MIGDANAVNLISLNKKWYETDSYKDVREIDILEDKKGEDPTRRIQKRDLMRLVTKGLNRNERLIIILYYYEELTMKEIGATLDLSESRASARCTARSSRGCKASSCGGGRSSAPSRLACLSGFVLAKVRSSQRSGPALRPAFALLRALTRSPLPASPVLDSGREHRLVAPASRLCPRPYAFGFTSPRGIPSGSRITAIVSPSGSTCGSGTILAPISFALPTADLTSSTWTKS